ncbi:MAG: PQQ-binding-like beta-propeller repeat protein [Acidobacteriota bacterium]
MMTTIGKRGSTLPWSGMAILLLLQLNTACATSEAADWSRFRGPNGSGVADAVGLPVEFGPEQNVIWKTALPPGHSSPILSASRIFLTAFEGDRLLTICLDRDTGEILWQRQSPRSREEKLDPRNSPASPSPVTDGEDVYVFFADYGLISYDLDGNERWKLPLGPFDNVYGMGASPILVDDKVLLVCDQSTGSFLIAVAKRDGRIVWRTERPEAKSGHSTPILYKPDDGPLQLIVAGSFFLTAYSVDSGEKLWWVGGLSFEIKSTPVIGDGVVYINGYGSPLNQPGNQIETVSYDDARARHDADGDGSFTEEEVQGTTAASWFDFVDLDADGRLGAEDWRYFRAAMASTNGLLAIRLGGSGDMSEQSVLWEYHRAVPQLPSPLLYESVLYMVNDGGIVTSLDPATGEVLAQGRLKGAVDSYYASPVAADGKIYFVSELGLVAVLAPGGSLDVIKVNDLDDLSYATPAIVDGRIYLRTRSTLYCFGLPQGA